MDRIVYRDERHSLEIIKKNGRQSARLYLKHHGITFLDVCIEPEEIQILKELFNKIVNNHNQLENYFKQNS